MGRLTQDPELRHTQTDVPVCSFTLAVSRDYRKPETGERETDFLDVVAWKQNAEFLTKNFTKGRMVVVEGAVQTRNWVDREGNRRRTVEIVADRLWFGDSRRPEDRPQQEEQRPADSQTGYVYREMPDAWQPADLPDCPF